MAPSIQELNSQGNPGWDFFGNGRGPSGRELPPWASFFQGPTNSDHGPLPNRGTASNPTSQRAPGPEAAGPPPYPRPWDQNESSPEKKGQEATPATESGPEKDLLMNDDDEEAGEPSGTDGERDRSHRHRHGHGHGHGPRGRGCGRGGFGGRGRGWGQGWGHHGHGHGHHDRGFGGWGHGGRGNWPSFLQEMARAGMGNIGDYYKQNMPNHPFAQWAKSNMDSQEFTPPVDVYDTPTSYEIHLSLPGAKKENISVTYNAEESTVQISGVVERPGDAEFFGYMAMGERQVGAFERKVRLGTRTEPAPVDDTHIGAKLEDGVLRVHVPKILKEDEFVEVRKVDIE